MHLRERIKHPDLQVTILHLAEFLVLQQEEIMSALTDLQTSVARNSELVDQLIATKGSSTPSGSGATDADIAGLTATVDANNGRLQAAIDAAAPAPAPAPSAPVTNPDGSTSVTNADGTVTTTAPDGTVTTA